MAVTINAVGTEQDAGFGVSSITFSFNPAAGGVTDLITVNSWAQTTGITTTGITFNGVALTSGIARTQVGEVSLWYLVAPASGAHNVVVTYSGSAVFVGSAQAVSWLGVNQASPIGNTNSSAAVGTTSVADAVNTSLDDAVLDSLLITTSVTPVVGPGQTQGINARPTFTIANSFETAIATSVTMSWTWAGSLTQGHVVMVIKTAVPHPPAPSPTVAMMKKSITTLWIPTRKHDQYPNR